MLQNNFFPCRVLYNSSHHTRDRWFYPVAFLLHLPGGSGYLSMPVFPDVLRENNPGHPQAHRCTSPWPLTRNAATNLFVGWPISFVCFHPMHDRANLSLHLLHVVPSR